LRRNDPGFDAQLRTYLFTTGSIMDQEGDATNGGPSKPVDGVDGMERRSSLGIGSMKRDV
jgi:hypothetical protein